jgi:phage protein U
MLHVPLAGLLAVAGCDTGGDTGGDTAASTTGGNGNNGTGGNGTGGNGSTTGGPTGGTGTDIGFRPAANGFPFANYGDGYTNLTAEDVRRFFGDGVCASLAGGQCTLTPAGAQWMGAQNQGMNGGHCEGFAALSLMFYTHQRNASDFGAAEPSALALDGNVPLQRELAYWFTTQALAPTNQNTVSGKTPNEILDVLTQAFAAGTSETYTLGIYQTGFKGGHAITPYALVDKGGGLFDLMVYDNNFPGAERAVSFDRNANTWSYQASTNPNEPESLYAGTADSKTLDLTPTSVRLQPQQCPFCGNATAEGPSLNGMRQLSLSGSGDILATDDSGHRLGYVGGQLVNEIPRAVATPFRSADLWKTKRDPTFSIPEGSGLTITLDGTALAAHSVSDLSLVGAGYTLGVEGIDLEPMQKDTILFSKDGAMVTYKTDGKETPTLVVGIETAGADWEFLIQASGDTNGQQVILKLDMTKQQLRVEAKNTAGSTTYTVEVHRIDDAGEQVFTHVGNSESTTDAIYLDYGTWAGQGMPMEAELDSGDDGTVDTTTSLTDDQ